MKSSTKSKIIAILLMFIFCLSIDKQIYAVENVCPEYSLADLYEAAIEKSEIIEISKEDVLISRIQKNKTLSDLIPNLSTFGDYRRYDKAKTASGGSFTIQPENAYTWGAKLEQSLSLGGREFIALNMSKKKIEKSKTDFKTVNENYLLNVASAYYNILKTQKTLKIAQENLNRLEKHKDVTKLRLKVGEITKTVVLRAEAEVSQAQSDVIRATNNLKMAKANLIKLTEIEDNFTVRETSFESIDIDELASLKEQAVTNRTELKSFDLQTQIAKDQVRFVKSTYLPDVSLEAAYTGNDTSPSTSFNNKDVIYGQISLKIPLIEGGRRKAEIDEAKSKLKQSELLYKDLKSTISLEVDDAYYNLMTQQSVLGKIQDQLKLAKDNYEKISEQFKEGFANSIDIVDANNFLVSTEQQLINAQYDYQIGILILKRATGVFLKEIDNDLRAQNKGVNNYDAL
ncbi:MAG: hypothetical protein A2287_04490 [Candidatus Melainabacteria bacterium RIFOXYA12_FULL_32_12]|nr:MAG: hypothetical protein A2255_03745 [Candidatus Melainabacteria bacterium RIFOXYA2_FULL_32_9]OGI31732.1 MAG: hypothetical protein A2287_04490 [Candidatus Melainabacteria bacterium RIFOXYA12_FULL_32_12]